MKKLIVLAVLSTSVLVAGCNRQPQPQVVYVDRGQQPVVVAQGNDCDADDRFEYDTDCGYTQFQHYQRMKYLKSRGYKRKTSIFARKQTAPVYRSPTYTSRPVYRPAPTYRSTNVARPTYSRPTTSYRSSSSSSFSSRPSSSSMSSSRPSYSSSSRR